MTRRPWRALPAAGLLAATVAGPAGPAVAAGSCHPGEGATVVVDYRSLGGGVRQACVDDGGGDLASALFPAAGYPLTYVAGEAFVCRVAGKPGADDEDCQDTPPADAYWGLFWSDGDPATWSYATLGVSALRIPEGGSVAFRWQDASGRSLPGPAPNAAAPPTPKPSPKPTPKPSPKPKPTHTPKPTPGPSEAPTPEVVEQKPSPSESRSESSAPSKRPKRSGSAEPTPTDSPSPTDAASPSTSPAASPTEDASDDLAAVATTSDGDGDGGGDGAWTTVAAALVLLLAAAAGAVAYRRRS